MADKSSPDRSISRRQVLVSTLGLLVTPRIAFGRDVDDLEIARVRGIAKKARLGELGVSKNDEYLAVGDAPEKFREQALKILVNLSKDYLQHFKEKGFNVHKPTGRMTVIMLANRETFTAYLGEDVPGLVGGVYSPDYNDLVLFDNRAAAGNPEAEKDNTLVLTHEAIHQLNFNTGLLERGGDIPKAITEGLANYAENRSPNGRDTKIGSLNHRRLISLARPRPGGPPPLAPVEVLIHNDNRIEARVTEQIAYSEAWLLVHYLMKTDKVRPKFRAYLKAIAGRKDATKRMDDWVEHLGDPKATDSDLVSYLRKMWTERGRP